MCSKSFFEFSSKSSSSAATRQEADIDARVAWLVRVLRVNIKPLCCCAVAWLDGAGNERRALQAQHSDGGEQQNELAEEEVVDAVEVAISGDVASILAVLDVAIVARAR